MASASENLTFKYASEHVARYRDEDDRIMSEHREALECMDCEAYLQLGIDAFNWIMKADAVWRDGVYNGRYEFDPAMESALQAMCRSWLKPCGNAEKWIAIQEKRGYTLSNLETFRRCCEEMKAIVASFDAPAAGQVVTDPLILLRDEALKEHRDGQTAEFI
jgi:hypothetical protein